MRRKLTELHELCFDPAPVADDGTPLPPSVHIYRYAAGRRTRQEGPVTDEHPVADRIDAEAFALRFGFVRDSPWRTTKAGYEVLTLRRPV